MLSHVGVILVEVFGGGLGGGSGCKYCRGTTKCSEAKLYRGSMKRQRREVRREGADLGPLLQYRSVGAAESENALKLKQLSVRRVD